MKTNQSFQINWRLGWVSMFIILFALSLACSGSVAIDSEADGMTDEENQGNLGKADGAFLNKPLYITGAFDGSQRFGGWIDTMEFARSIDRRFSKKLRFSYFINTCFFDRNVRGSDIGTALSREEEIVRWALVQQTVNEGHEIANHTVRHKDGGRWSKAQWETEIQEFHTAVEKNLFNPVLKSDGKAAFPQWEAMSGTEPGDVGYTCSSDSDCDSGKCMAVSADLKFCTQSCNAKKKCPNGTVCGAPDWQQSTDVCVPMPKFPVVINGETLFDAEANANLQSAKLVPYKVVGMRAPLLANNRNMFEVLSDFNYLYDTSQVISIGAPKRATSEGKVFETIYEFGLMKNAGSQTIPMDYNYYVNNGSGERMLSDYKKSIVDAYQVRGKQPWNIGHHFSLWKSGAYWTAMKGAFEFAAQGCLENGIQKCPDIEFPTFIELAKILDEINEDKTDDASGDIFIDPTAAASEEIDVVPGPEAHEEDGIE